MFSIKIGQDVLAKTQMAEAILHGFNQAAQDGEVDILEVARFAAQVAPSVLGKPQPQPAPRAQ